MSTGNFERIIDDDDEGEIYKHKTGIVSLDNRLGMTYSDDKGIPDKSLILVHSPADSNMATLLIQRILTNLCERDENNFIFYIHSSRPKTLIMRDFTAYNVDIKPFVGKRWLFKDMYGLSGSIRASSSKIGKIDIRRKTYIKHIFKDMVHISKNQNKQCFSVVDNLLWIKEEVLDEKPDALIEFLKDLTDLILQIGGIHFLLLEKDIINPVAERLIMSSVQGIFDFSKGKKGTKTVDTFRISKLVGLAFISETMEISPSETLGFMIESTGAI
jgi:hypothetical protein